MPSGKPYARIDELGARASALAGSLLSLLRWWLDRGEKESPHDMDELFHRWCGTDSNRRYMRPGGYHANETGKPNLRI